MNNPKHNRTLPRKQFRLIGCENVFEEGEENFWRGENLHFFIIFLKYDDNLVLKFLSLFFSSIL